jgi:hypothetical protein
MAAREKAFRVEAVPGRVREAAQAATMSLMPSLKQRMKSNSKELKK